MSSVLARVCAVRPATLPIRHSTHSTRNAVGAFRPRRTNAVEAFRQTRRYAVKAFRQTQPIDMNSDGRSRRLEWSTPGSYPRAGAAAEIDVYLPVRIVHNSLRPFD